MKKHLLILSVICLLALLMSPLPALAQYTQVQPTDLTLDACAPGFQPWQVTGRIVFCIQNMVITGVTAFATAMTAALRAPIGILACLAVIFFGIKIGMGEKELPKFSFGFMVRVAMVLGFAFNMAYVVRLPFLIVEDALSMVTGGWSPWLQIDTAIGRLLGFGPGIALFQGVLGLMGAAMFSSAQGAFLFLFGFLVILSLLGFILRAIYTYLTSMVMIGFMMAISVMVIPMAIMGYTERYLKKWMDMLIASMLMPIMLFAFLWIFLMLIEIYIGSIFTVLGGNNFSALWKPNSQYFSWAMITDPSLLSKIPAEPGSMKGNQPVFKALMNPSLRSVMDLGGGPSRPGVNFGPNSMAIIQQLILHFVAMAITCYLLRSMIESIPQLSDAIAGTTTGIQFERMEMLENVKKAAKQAMSKGAKS